MTVLELQAPLPPPMFFQPMASSAPIRPFSNPEATSVSGTVRLPIKRALLVGINYIGNRAQLKGCINDVCNMRRLLVETFGWTNDDQIRILSDDQRDPEFRPTRANIVLSMRWLAEDVRRGNFLLIYICNFPVLNQFLLIFICKLHWNLKAMFWFFTSLGMGVKSLTPTDMKKTAWMSVFYPWTSITRMLLPMTSCSRLWYATCPSAWS